MFSGLGYTEMLLFGIIALMLFGSKLPEMARTFGGKYRDLRRKVDEFQREFRDWDRIEPTPKRPATSYSEEPERAAPASPKFVPPPPDDE